MLVLIDRQNGREGGDGVMAKSKQRPGKTVSFYFEDLAVLDALDMATAETRRQNHIMNWSRSRQAERMLADQLGVRREVKLYLPSLKPQSKKPQ